MERTAKMLFDAARSGHNAGMEQAKQVMPALELNEIISLVAGVFTAKDNRADAALKAAQILADKYQKPIEVYLNAFSVKFVEDGLKNVQAGTFSQLGNAEFAKRVVASAKDTKVVIASFCAGEIDAEQLISHLCHNGVLDIGESFLEAAGVDMNAVKATIQQTIDGASKGGIVMISYYASVEAYQILSQALKDAAGQREERLRIEAECTESIVKIRQYREEMQRVVSDYLYTHAETFNAGIAAMDDAILQNDVNGFIRGNTEIQAILHYQVQFRNEAEFEDLMASEKTFKL